MVPLEPVELLGQRLLSVAVAWHEFGGERGPEPVHVWLQLDRSGYVKCHTPGNGDLGLYIEAPYEPYDMQEFGRVTVVEGEPPSLAAHVGGVVQAVTPVHEATLGFPVGVVLTFPSGAVAITNLGDDLVVGAWPEAFRELGVHAPASRD